MKKELDTKIEVKFPNEGNQRESRDLVFLSRKNI